MEEHRSARRGNGAFLRRLVDAALKVHGTGFYGAAQHRVINFTDGNHIGAAYLVWDGKERKVDSAKGCQQAEPAPGGPYQAASCFGWKTIETPKGTDVEAECYPMPFQSPTDKVRVQAGVSKAPGETPSACRWHMPSLLVLATAQFRYR